MLNRKLVEYTDISSKYVKVGVRYRLFVGFLLSVFDFHVTVFPLFSSLVCLRVCVRPFPPSFTRALTNLFKTLKLCDSLMSNVAALWIKTETLDASRLRSLRFASVFAFIVSRGRLISSVWVRPLDVPSSSGGRHPPGSRWRGASRKPRNGPGGVCANTWRAEASSCGAQWGASLRKRLDRLCL